MKGVIYINVKFSFGCWLDLYVVYMKWMFLFLAKKYRAEESVCRWFAQTKFTHVSLTGFVGLFYCTSSWAGQWSCHKTARTALHIRRIPWILFKGAPSRHTYSNLTKCFQIYLVLRVQIKITYKISSICKLD